MNEENERRRAGQADGARSENGAAFSDRVFLAYGIGAIFLLLIVLLWFASTVVLLVFASILLAVLLQDASAFLEKRLHLPHGPALAVVLLLVAGILALGGWFLAPQISAQTSQLVSDLPAALQRLRDYVEQHPALQKIAGSLPQPEKVFGDAPAILARAGSAFTGLLGALGNLVFILFVAIYMAAQPGVYTSGFTKILPKKRRQRGRAVLEELRKTLSLWLRGKLMSMTLIGIATAIGLTLLDVPLALALGVIAGLLDFIPYLGPLLAAVPAILIAFSQSPTLALYTLILFGAVQALESYLLAPLIDRKMVALPPALTITMQVLMGLAFGLFGVALATPLTAAFAVMIAMLYVEEVLEDQVQLPGDAE